MPRKPKKPEGPTPEDQRRHDQAVAALTAVTDKPLGELTLEEFRWLTGRVFLPVGETPQSQRRREFAGNLVGDEQHRFWMEVRAADKLPPVIPSVQDHVDEAYRLAIANKTSWPETL